MRRLIPVCCLLFLAAPSAAARADVEEQVTASGAIVVSWHGDPARGCAAAGLCDVAGTMTLEPAADQGTTISTGERISALHSSVDFEAPVVRVTRGTQGACVDGLGRMTMLLSTDGATRQIALQPGFDVASTPLASGRCAGPAPGDLDGLLPSSTLPSTAARRREVRLDLAGRRSSGAGPFAVDMDSDLHVEVRWRRVPPGSGGSETRFGPVERVRSRRRAVLTATYEVTAAGTVAARYWALAERGCSVLDACGVRGALTLAVRPRDGARLRVRATGPASLARGGVRRALAALARGRMDTASDDLGTAFRGRLDAEVVRDGVQPCRDGRDVELPPLALERSAGAARLSFGSESYGGYGGLWRTRCPGPASPPSGPLIAGRLTARALAATRAVVPLRPAFGDTWPYAVAGGGDATMTLRRIAARVRVEEVGGP